MGFFNKEIEKNNKSILNDENSDFIDDIEFDKLNKTHFEPLNYGETKQIADCLLKFNHVTISLKLINIDERKRLIDFLTGVMYGFNGNYKKIDKSIYYFWISK
ncbi:cell division protein SepF [Spiroplasma taiwanense]|uniref:Cell division protein SepF n=1 Tax=Spiroplasma taiwanense CT-1 TaxID=1276220 RepID=S5LXZ2_9MOLU|nr:cell division protein SepF [Spiroplasma taiwanense]AGR41471.1 hypothetical protein STAIW_v1c08850 [Spiroplasma taiwanense CT-1]